MVETVPIDAPVIVTETFQAESEPVASAAKLSEAMIVSAKTAHARVKRFFFINTEVRRIKGWDYMLDITP